MSRSTVSGITGELLQSGLIVEGSVTRSTGGRPSINLEFRHQGFAVVGVELGGSHVACVRTDLRGDIAERLSERCPVRDDPEQTLALMHRLLEQLLQGMGDERICVGLGRAFPCPLATSAPGQLSDRILPHWQGIELGQELFERYRVPILTDNDANLGALAEAWWGAGRGIDHFTYMKGPRGSGLATSSGARSFAAPPGSRARSVTRRSTQAAARAAVA